jgi:hypothetical protein
MTAVSFDVPLQNCTSIFSGADYEFIDCTFNDSQLHQFVGSALRTLWYMNRFTLEPKAFDMPK